MLCVSISDLTRLRAERVHAFTTVSLLPLARLLATALPFSVAGSLALKRTSVNNEVKERQLNDLESYS